MTGTVNAEQKRNVLSYAILKLADWAMETNGWNLVEFNIHNNFTETKVMLLPFYMSTANGKTTRTEMFSFFDNFKAEENGYIEQDIKANINNIPYINFNPNSGAISIDATVLNDGKVIDFVHFKKEHNLTATPAAISLEKPVAINIQSVYDLIDYSLSVYKNNKWFIADYEEGALIRLCRRHSGWQVYRMLEPFKGKKVDPSILINEKSVYALEEANRIVV